jgi:hypothetical protein
VSLRQKVKLELDDGKEVEVTYDGRDLRAWETKYRKSALTETMTLGMLTYVGWSAAKRQGILNGSYDTYEAFDAVCVSVQGVRAETTPPEGAEDTETGPTKAQKGRTRKTVGDGSSAP